MKQLINGQPTAYVDAADRGLAYGDGLFETLVCDLHTIQHWDRHWHRLHTGLVRLGFNFHGDTLKHSLEKDIDALLDEVNTIKTVIKIIITRGVSKRGYQTDKQAPLTRIVQCSDFPKGREQYCQQGIQVRLCQHRWSENTALAGLKHLNRLDQVLARQEWQDDSFQEGMMLNQQGNIQSGVMSNVFVQINQSLYTPLNEGAGIQGVMAENIKYHAKILGVAVTEQPIPLSMVSQAEAIFLCNSLNGIWPVIKFEQHHYSISSLTRQLQALC